jgi:hypothetical protein
MIDFDNFTKPINVKVPILFNSFVYNRKKYFVKESTNNWYNVSIVGNDVKVNYILSNIEFESFENLNVIKGYIYNNNLIFQNFDVGKRKLNKEIMSPIHYNILDNFSSIEAIIWEDGNLFY